MSKLQLIFKALRQLGLSQLLPYAWYQFCLRTGYLRWGTRLYTREGDDQSAFAEFHPLLPIPTKEQLEEVLGDEGSKKLIAESEEIVAGKVRIFGELIVDLDFQALEDLHHWTAYETGEAKLPISDLPIPDIKYLWEPARFGWSYTLGRAYLLLGEERFPEAFWRYFEAFHQANPPYMGPHWISGQEVALRLMALVFAAQLFSQSEVTTPQRKVAIARSIANHASRIPPTLAYARAQNNNHLLSEAVGLLTAGLALPDHPNSDRWRQMGWGWFNRGIRSQVAEDGSYVQHSTNYHRLMMHLALWVTAICRNSHLDQPKNEYPSTKRYRGDQVHQYGYPKSVINDQSYLGLNFPKPTTERLIAATRWLRVLLDETAGSSPNLGPNDGARILHLSASPFHDYRPVIQAAGRAFLGRVIFEVGLWDELSLWLGLLNKNDGEQGGGVSEVEGGLHKLGQIETSNNRDIELSSLNPVRISSRNSWGYLRNAVFTSRPGHADQLHFDLWWRGYNIAKDAGTYLYNAQPPWDNSLSRTQVHNTITVEDRDQMIRAGRFLWLDWAQGKVISVERGRDRKRVSVAAVHNGYSNVGIQHQRKVTCFGHDRWLVEDHLQCIDPLKKEEDPTRKIRLHWLLPDWPWEVDETDPMRIQLRLESPLGWIDLNISILSEGEFTMNRYQVQLIRGGELLYGSNHNFSPIMGWESPTYAKKVPALSFSISIKNPLPVSLSSDWYLP